MSVIELSNLTKKFSSLIAVNSLDLKIEKGEIFGFLGPNGAGKTTTIRLLLDFIRPTSGSIKLFGTQFQTDAVQIKEKIGYLPADDSLFVTWTGFEHIEYFQKIRHQQATNIANLIKVLDYNPKLRVGTLSSGNKQKLSIILALMFNPELLILDEPTKSLDPILQHVFYDLLKTANTNGTTIFISSHNLNEVDSLCTNTGIIKAGKLVALEKMSDLKRKQIHNLDVVFVDKIFEKDLQAEFVDDIIKYGEGFRIKVKEDLNPVLHKITKYKIKTLNISQASLEDIFLEFYK